MYVEYNLNPKQKKTGDCSIRAVGLASKIGWDKAYEGLSASGFKLKTAMNDVEAINDFLLSIGFREGKVKVPKGSKRPTVAQFAEQHPDWYAVLRVANHITCCGRGNYVDIWDCGDSCVYKYWYRPIQ
jgi:hypothetical protein